MNFIIYGNPITKKNSQNVVFVGKKCPVCHKGARAIPIQSEAYKKYEKLAAKQLPKLDEPIAYPVTITCRYFMQTRRPVDLSNLLAATSDILVKYKVLEDDNCNIIASYDGSRVLYDKEEPRVEISVEPF